MLKLKLLQTCHDNDSFIAYWFTLIHIVQSTSVERFEEVKRAFKGRNIGPANQNDQMDEVIKEEFEKFKLLNPDLAEQKTTKKDLTFYWNLIQSNNMKVSKVYARQTNCIDKDTT